jgi:hypothetical protein
VGKEANRIGESGEMTSNPETAATDHARFEVIFLTEAAPVITAILASLIGVD